MSAASSMLEFEAVALRTPSAQVEDLTDVSFRLAPGGVALIELEDGHEHVPLADAAQGLLAPESGEVRFQGTAWAAMGPHDAASARGRTRRVFDGNGWVSNLDVIENVCLGEYHHTRRHFHEIRAEAEAHARAFGLSGVPDGRPSHVPTAVLRRMEWVRAFIGQPDLIILERPLVGVPKDHLHFLAEAVSAALAKGTAVLWTTAEGRDWDTLALAGLTRYQMQHAKLVPLTGDAT